MKGTQQRWWQVCQQIFIFFLMHAICWTALGYAAAVSADLESPLPGPARLAPRVLAGLDVLEAQRFAPLRGKHIGVITNHTGLDASGRSTVDVLTHATDLKVIALFSPEHGLAGRADEKVSSTTDPVSGLPVYSLYGETQRPTDDMLKGIDTLVFDVQDAGVRFYTYTTTMAYCMEEAAKRHIAFFVLDRPNPLNGNIVEGPMLDPDKASITAYFPLPVRYGLTIGELAQLFNGENKLHCDLHVIAMKNWRRNYFFEGTHMKWVPPSPNLRTLKGSILYPGLEILQNAGVSVGRGTETPFEQFGAPWMIGETVAAKLNNRHLPGLRFAAHTFIPVTGLHAGQQCSGVAVDVIEGRSVRAMSMGLAIAIILHQLYPEQFDPAKILLLIGNAETIQQLQAGVEPSRIVASWTADLQKFEAIRQKYFIYK